MAVARRPLLIPQAKERRVRLPRYLRLDQGRYLIAAALLLSLMSLLSLGQIGRLSTKGYAISQLQAERTVLLREQSDLQIRLSKARSLDSIEQRAIELGLRPASPEQRRYMSFEELADPAEVVAPLAPGVEQHTGAAAGEEAAPIPVE